MDTPVLVIGNKNYSSWSLRPWLLLRHLGIAFDEVRIALDTPEFQQQIKRYSNAGRVPVYIQGERRIWDSLAICEFLAEKHPEAWPSSENSRALARSVCAEMHAGFSALRSELPMNCRAHDRIVKLSDAAKQDISRIENIWELCRKYRKGDGPWLFGDFSVADAFYAPVVVRFNGYRLELKEHSHLYCQTQLNNTHLQEWMHAGQEEHEIIAAEETGEEPG